LSFLNGDKNRYGGNEVVFYERKSVISWIATFIYFSDSLAVF